MRSQAQQVSKTEYWNRLSAVITGNDIYALSAERTKLLWFRTPYDQKIATLEDAIAQQKSRAWQFIDSARRWQFRGEHERCADQVKYARQVRKTIAGLRQTLRDTVAERDGHSVSKVA